MAKIKLESIEFGDVPFRKLKSMLIPIADCITLIAGHNGIGKSTILGLISNTSGLTHQTPAPRSYFERLFQANLSEIIFIDYDNEFLSAKEDESIPRPIVTYLIEGQKFQKRCGLTDRSNTSARIVPRNFSPSKDFISSKSGIKIGSASKVPLPTIYLGLTRILPIGEAEEKTVFNELIKTIHDDDKALIVDFINGVVAGLGAKTDKVTSNRIRGTSKFSSHPTYTYDPKCVSVGQDSLGSIAAALASFQMLKREWADYPGGLLVIDELDSGLHPHAIRRLADKLQAAATKLDLQIIATTHSPALIESIYANSNGKATKTRVTYLMDTAAPYALEAPGLLDIIGDMELLPPGMSGTSKAPNLRIYLEDDEAKQIFDLLITGPIKRSLGKNHGVSIKAFSLGIGCDSLANLSSVDPRFQESLFVLDADADIKPKHLKHGNIVKLPGADKKSPERTLFAFIKALVEQRDNHPGTWGKLKSINVTSDQIQMHLLDWQGDVSKRTEAKKWWRDRVKYLNSWGIFKLWMAENPNAVDAFRTDFEKAVKATSKRVRRLAKLGITS
ncbi:ATP-binding protein [Xanthomonas graminis]|nr:ATP-binding protein [Xanthomonas translucens]